MQEVKSGQISHDMGSIVGSPSRRHHGSPENSHVLTRETLAPLPPHVPPLLLSLQHTPASGPLHCPFIPFLHLGRSCHLQVHSLPPFMSLLKCYNLSEASPNHLI